ncbi:hypothetical protein THIOSC13_10009 [uncultured Thiomicrorhabdus sp.]
MSAMFEIILAPTKNGGKTLPKWLNKLSTLGKRMLLNSLSTELDEIELLDQIGVVPKNVQQFIKQLNQLELNACAKVCGAGAVAGDSAGVVIYFGTKAPNDLCDRMGYKFQPLTLYKSSGE